MYGSDPFSYDFAAALAASPAGSDSPIERTYDKRASTLARPSKLPKIVGLFNGSFCRRCEARFIDLDTEGKREHRQWHEWQDENASRGDITPELERSFYENLAPSKGYAPDGEVIALSHPTRSQLDAHEKRFMPPADRGHAEARKAHRAACAEIADLYCNRISEDDVERMVLDLRRSGLPVTEIADQLSVNEKLVKTILRGAVT